MTISATVPAAKRDQANLTLEEAGHGPNNFSVPVRKNPNASVTHYGLHAWDDGGFLAALQELSIPGLVIRNEAGQVVNLNAHLSAQGMDMMQLNVEVA